MAIALLPRSEALSALPSVVQPCQRQIAKSSGKLLKAYLKEIRKCKLQDLKEPGACPVPNAAAIAEAESKVASEVDEKCSALGSSQVAVMGFPGFCTDLDGPPFTVTNVKQCMVEIHESQGNSASQVVFGTTSGPLSGNVFKCQAGIASAAAKFLSNTLKALQKCRDGIDGGKLVWNPAECESEPRSAKRLTAAFDKLQKVILAKCTDADVQALDVCDPPATTALEAVSCLRDSHEMLTRDLARFEYADPPSCGDNFVNQPGLEECDGTDDGACPGACGAPGGLFPCLCTDVPRLKVFEFKESDLDTGWTGDSHDHGVVEGGGYVLDLSYCDNITDFDCLTGPHCSATEALCKQDSDCPPGETCVKSATATGPHCSDDIMQPCDICIGGSRDGQLCGTPGCPGGTCATCNPGATCLKQLHGPPLPLSGGGVPVCVVTTFTEDIRGTRNIATGASSGRIRQGSVTHTGITVAKPCPVCGGFCATTERQVCAADSDCPAGASCITSHVCSDGANKNNPCRAEAPFGGPTTFFGTTSVDCPPSASQNISGGGLDIIWDPITTGTNTVFASVACTQFKVCSGSGDICLETSDCPSGQSCNPPPACWCAGQEKPNKCNPACIGGGDDGEACVTGSDCESGVCKPAECRLNPSDPNGPTEGFCPAGPVTGTCSIERFRNCTTDANCQPPGCPSCAPGQTCIVEHQQCFTDPIVRTGVASTGISYDEAVFCIDKTTSSSVNITAGLPGPGAVRSPVTFFLTGF